MGDCSEHSNRLMRDGVLIVGLAVPVGVLIRVAWLSVQQIKKIKRQAHPSTNSEARRLP